jgi:hypothetical protein
MKDMKYLMSLMDKLEISLFFSPLNLVILSIHPEKRNQCGAHKYSDGKDIILNNDFETYPEVKDW